MTEVNDQEFINRLYGVIHKLSGIANSQSYRFEHLWKYFEGFDLKPHVVRRYKIDKDKFFSDNDYRISITKTVADSMVDGFYSIKSILQVLYQHYYQDSELFIRDFPSQDARSMLKYFTAKEILGNLIQYSKMDHETVPLKYNIIARHRIMMKLQGVDLKEILQDLTKLNKNIERNVLIKLMEEIRDDGIITIEQNGDSYIYKLACELKLDSELKKQYTSTFQALVDWPTQFWRSYYNVRELNLTPKESTPHREFLIKILGKSATQGFGPAYYVFQNLEKYFQKLKDST